MSETLNRIVLNVGCIESRATHGGINPELVYKDSDTIYLGTGLCTSTGISEGIPFDSLSMILVAEKIKREMSMSTVYHQIADVHAKTNEGFNHSAIDRLAYEELETYHRIVERLDFPAYEIMLASKFDKNLEFMEILNSVNVDTTEYRRRELADIEYFRSKKNTKIKVGWTIDSSPQPPIFDERSFDRLYKAHVSSAISFIYSKAGRTFDRERPKASPYINLPYQTRIMLRKGENVREILQRGEESTKDKGILGAKRHLNSILRLYQDVVGETLKGSLEERIEAVISRVFD